MFRIKKDDYNTVQFLPDFQTSRFSRRKQKKQKAARAVESAEHKMKKVQARKRGVILLLVVALILLALWFVYSRYFTPGAQFVRLFQQGDFARCSQIAEENTGDAVFNQEIESTVMEATNTAVTKYLDREVSLEETQQILTQYDQASAELFHQYIGDNQNWIMTIESIYEKASQAEAEAQQGYYTESITKLQQVAEEAGKNSLVLDQRITQILRDNLSGYKANLFVGFSNTLRYDSDYSTVTDTVAFINKYIQDDDFAGFPDVVAKLQSGEYSKVAAARAARQIAKNAGANIEVNEGSGSSPSSSSSASSGSSSSKSSASGSKKSSAGKSSDSGSSGSSTSSDDNEDD